MKWINASDQLPKHKEEVLIRCRGVFNLAIYDHDQRKFKLRNESFYKPDSEHIEWLRLEQP